VKTFNLGEAKAKLSRIVRDVRSGKEPEIIIALGGEPVVRVVPLGGTPRRALGIDAGLVALPPDFDAADAAIAELFAAESSKA
jgi:antitoxin (DNA-binding transcriptional repressor) of toxin-antitoxin stability system